jgi:menaquinone-dependent protoporphyrinogen oxidase
MNILIAYGTKSGTVEKCAHRLADLLKMNVEISNLKKANHIEIAKFEIIIIGGSVRMGKINPEVKKFCTDYLEQLLKKKICLFICGIVDEEKYLEELYSSFPEELTKHSFANGYFGGEIIIDKLNFIEKTIIKKVLKTDLEQYKISEDNIKKFASQINHLIDTIK